MWFTKITGIYWKEKKRHTFCIDEKSEKAEHLYEALLESLQYEMVVFEIVKNEEYWKEEEK